MLAEAQERRAAVGDPRLDVLRLGLRQLAGGDLGVQPVGVRALERRLRAGLADVQPGGGVGEELLARRAAAGRRDRAAGAGGGDEGRGAGGELVLARTCWNLRCWFPLSNTQRLIVGLRSRVRVRGRPGSAPAAPPPAPASRCIRSQVIRTVTSPSARWSASRSRSDSNRSRSACQATLSSSTINRWSGKSASSTRPFSGTFRTGSGRP